MSIPWIEKYRPKCVDDISYQDEIVAVLKKVISNTSGEFPNFLFYGPPGTGKTSTILAAARELYGPELMKTRVLELNSSDERGINVIREKVKTFSQFTASGQRSDGKPCPPFKIVILDEADSMTSAAQAALRRTMEKESKTTRFCLICNYISRIIEPITSRCSKFRFKPLSKDILIQRLEYICTQEKVDCDRDTLATLVSCSEGDLRKAITYLQCAARLKAETNCIKSSDILEIAGILDDKVISKIIDTCSTGSFEKIETCVQELIYDGFSCNQVVSQLHDALIERADFSDIKKAVIFEKIAEVDINLMEGADEYLQLLDLLVVVMKQMK
jgi:replication factor C subunit 2/4